MPDARIELQPADATWPAQFEAEAALLRPLLAPWLAGEIEHIGSTAVPGLIAKPVIDLMAPVHSLQQALPALAALTTLGYLHAPYRADEMHWFCKPSPAMRTHHLHLVPLHGPRWRQTLAFRDALRHQAGLADRYADLKRRLAAAHPDDREAYTAGKAPFIEAALQDATSSTSAAQP